MSFTSEVFLIVFFPLLVIINYGIKERWRNGFLCGASIIFYGWCGLKFLLLILVSASLAYLFGLSVERARTLAAKRRILLLSIGCHLFVLFFYKYLFALFPGALDVWQRFRGTAAQEIETLVLPLGISFYTFSIISYLLDIYWEKCRAQKNLLNVWLYVLFFPKVIQGPIMEYSAFEAQLSGRELNLDTLNQGAVRLIKGMFKKVMIADQLSVLVQYAFNDVSHMGTITAWGGIMAYLLQLYYDFSGYSDMAVGLGLMAGFVLPENFDHPYLAKSVGEYWRRWHISLGQWFRDYVYMPVSRFLVEREWIGRFPHPMLVCDVLSLLAVWTLTGIWHGSGFKYFAWGIWYFLFIAAERIRDFHRKQRRKKRGIKGKKLSLPQRLGDRLLFLAALVFGQVIFRAKTFSDACVYVKRLLFWTPGDSWYIFYELNNYRVFALVLGLVFIFPVYGLLEAKVQKGGAAAQLTYRICLLLAAFVVFCYAVGSGYSAFLYEVF